MNIYNAFERFFGLHLMDDSNFGELLKEIRLTADLTSSELAQKSSISQSYISQLENNARLPSDKVIKKLAYGIIERNNQKSDVSKLLFSSEEKEKKWHELVDNLIAVRNTMRIKDIPSIIERDETEHNIIITKEEKKLLKTFSELPPEKKQNLLQYIKFLKES
ncbi:hypothetical protein IGL01_002336 [Enterococcus sp. DIV0340]|uniref:helix-turn-helix domain-containing protein n=1 Tax=unclassified Enterococcus TaxID=2608891 RepID=UPI0022AC90F8|nr:helix-turn-helix domain-containing protein [Enterococcus faecalis]